MSDSNSNVKIPLGGLWANSMKDGSMYFSGSLGQGKLVIFPNGYKEKDTDPDYKMYLAPKQKKNEGSSNRAPETDIF